MQKGPLDQQKRKAYFKHLIKEAFDSFDLERNGYIQIEEVSSIMRYLGQFPSEAQISNYIAPELQEDEQPQFVSYTKFEDYMVKVLGENEFEPDDAETLLLAFRELDTEKKGYIEVEAMEKMLCGQGIELRDREWKEFLSFALDPETNVIYYEDYISRLIMENEKHMESLAKGYEKFKYP